MRKVLSRVREEQGPDAVILSNRRVPEGIEVVAAVDYDEALIRHALGAQPTAAEFSRIAEPADDASVETDDINIRNETDVDVIAADLRQVEREEIPVDDDAIVEIDTTSASIGAMQTELVSVRQLLESQLSGLVWKDSARRSPMRAQILRNLARIGIAPDIANIIVNRLEPVQGIKQIWQSPLAELARLIPVKEDSLLEHGGIVALIGPTGVGKTTTIAKMASRYAMTHGSDDIALICADAYRIGAKEHLTAFGHIIGVKVHAASTSAELTELLDRLRSKKLILIDTEGMSQRDMDLSNRLASYGSNLNRVHFYLTLSAASQEAGLDEIIRQFSKVPLAGAVVSKIDEAGQLGCVLSALIRNDLPALWLSDGQRIPDDLHAAARKRLWLVNQAVECMEASNPKIDERTMAENYSQASVAHG
jgi:flagellar biosynthesis protein FlhF